MVELSKHLFELSKHLFGQILSSCVTFSRIDNRLFLTLSNERGGSTYCLWRQLQIASFWGN